MSRGASQQAEPQRDEVERKAAITEQLSRAAGDNKVMERWSGAQKYWRQEGRGKRDGGMNKERIEGLSKRNKEECLHADET